jgi:hypothetical protein
MSDAEIKRRKKIQGKVSQTTGALGLTSLGAFAAGRAGGTGKIATRAQKAIPAFKRINPKKADSIALGTSTTAGGIGGLGAFNFASYTNAEGRKKKPVAKSDTPYVGEEGIAKRYETELEEIEKAGEWKTIDQRERTQRRDRKVQTAAGAAIGTGAGLAVLGNQESKGSDLGYVRQEARGLRTSAKWATTGKSPVTGKRMTGREFWDSNKHAGKILNRRLTPKTKAGAALVAAGAVTGGAAKGQQSYQQHKINERRRGNFKKSFDAERDRHKRAKAYPYVAGGAAGVAGLGALKNLGESDNFTRPHTKEAAAQAKKLKVKAGRKGVAAAGLTVGAGVLHRKKKSDDWASYAKSASSAFGVQHD